MSIRLTAIAVVMTSITAVFAQSPPSGPTFDVVSIKKHVAEPGPMRLSSSVNMRPDGGFTMTNIPVLTLIARAHEGIRPADMVGLPDWARSERYDVSATSTLTKATADDRIAMMRAMLADRFKLVMHFEKREQPAYNLLVDRSDGRLGAGLVRIDTDCAPQIAAQREAFAASGPPTRPDLDAPPPPCTLRSVRGRTDPSDRLEGETTMANLAEFLWMPAGRVVVDKTGLTGSYRVKMNFDLFGTRRPPEVTPPPDAAPTVFTALQEQLGLKLESAKGPVEMIVIDSIEPPTED